MMAGQGAGFGDAAVADQPPLRMGILGVGRIGRMHAGLLLREVPGTTVTAVADALPEVARNVADSLGVVAMEIDELLASDEVDAVAICTSTDTHVDLIIRAASAGKAILCEKPVSLDLAEVERALAAVEAAGVPFMVGFNRRFDAGHAAVAQAVRTGTIGDLHLLRITSRDPAPPPPEYVAVSGGIFLDMMIHDFDMARFVAGSEVVEVYARGAVRVDPRMPTARSPRSTTRARRSMATTNGSRPSAPEVWQCPTTHCATPRGCAPRKTLRHNHFRGSSWTATCPPIARSGRASRHTSARAVTLRWARPMVGSRSASALPRRAR